jgi:hypothetical protein
MSNRLLLEVRVDPAASRGDMVQALAAMLLARAKARLSGGERVEGQSAGEDRRDLEMTAATLPKSGRRRN